MNVWVFSVNDEFIVKRNASFYKHRTLDIKTGNMVIELIQGYPRTIPNWTTIQKIGGEWIAEYDGKSYNISDLCR
jgi:hypothetical protein